MSRSLKISLLFLATGIAWALFGNHITSAFSISLTPIQQKLIELAFMAAAAIAVFITLKKGNRPTGDGQYQRLFESNPNPLWIYDSTTLRFVKVNDAAIEKYQYSREQFLTMTIMNIRPHEEHDKLTERLKKLKDEVRTSVGWRHMKASGEIINVSIVSYPVLFDGKQCSLVIATDITELVEKEQKLQIAYQKIKSYNDALRQIAWSNSHEMRKPVCSIISLVSLLKHTDNNQERRQYLNLLETAATELDEVLRHNEKMAEVETEIES